VLWKDDYTRYAHYLEKGKNLFITGAFKQRYEKSEFEFRIDRVILLESIKQNLTKQLVLEMEAKDLKEEWIEFIKQNVKTHPGKSQLRLNIRDSRTNWRVGLYTSNGGFEMNDEMAAWLYNNADIETQVLTI